MEIQKGIISIITINFFNLEITLDMLRSIASLNRDDLEVIVVELGSEKCDKSPYIEVMNDVIVIHNKDNIGFSAGNNLGIDHAKGEFLYLVNNDTELSNSSIDPLVIALKDQKIGIVSPKIKYYDQKNIIQYAGYTLVNPYTGRNATIGNLEEDHHQYDDIYETGYIHGAAMMTTREHLEKVGKMPLEFFLYYEELDWTSSFHKHKLKSLFVGEAEILHKESMSVGKDSPLKEYFIARNRIIFMRKSSNVVSFFIFFVFCFLFSLPKRLFNLIIEPNKYTLIKPLLTGYYDALHYIINPKKLQPNKGLMFR
ncbi:glycosyltransferase family 2 protein [Flammeovirga yaeyamensis]|uniref:Glycosyltransferase family 2 protein n=1 Tax=Flammeovirga yaeyamensis TaxID=367791 RepID=A0AAX1NEP1_9BACT|nr:MULTISPECIES: glycosyltransferase family 2 protein [Flammeovirga]ANQ52079.1 glycosyltransferase family 2 protein [Flammeovirga sp. MY04]MBB3699254.1 hypothetical protein [Flammeovirga yaeyamensis]NMF35483.1 glycosyltransferase family 2 protein [Flammeovirga yaeyamensis]QWG04343.1 glycosyltransferase family 2 protein [Flammeovirga yaeyamensis]